MGVIQFGTLAASLEHAFGKIASRALGRNYSSGFSEVKGCSASIAGWVVYKYIAHYIIYIP